MKSFIIYHRANGEILRTGSCPNNMLSLQIRSFNEKLIEGRANDLTDKISNGKVISKSQEELAADEKANLPNPTELLIQQKMQQLLRTQAVEELKREGKIDRKY